MFTNDVNGDGSQSRLKRRGCPSISKGLPLLFLKGLPLLFLGQAVAAEPSLAKLVDVAEQNLQRQAELNPEQQALWVSQWLADAPTLSASIYQSSESEGSDEYEIALTLPLKSPRQHQADNDLKNTTSLLAETISQYRRWYASGQLRDAYWTYQHAQITEQTLTSQLSLYQDIEQHAALLSQSGEIDAYQRYSLQHTATSLAIQLSETQTKQQQAKQRLKQLIGSAEIPSETEQAPASNTNNNQHPRLRMLQLEAQALQQSTDASIAQPWELTAAARRVTTPGFDDDQIGVQLAIPLQFGANMQTSQAQQSDYQIALQNWQSQYNEITQTIQIEQQQSQQQLAQLQRHYQLLEQEQPLREQAKQALIQRIKANEISLDIAQQQLQQILSNELRQQQLKIEIEHARANLQQALGKAL